MKIKTIDILRVSLPFETGGPRNGLRPGLSAWTSIESLMVRLVTDQGHVGWGEAFGHFVNPGTAAILQSLVGPWFIGKDARAIAPLMEQAHRAFFGFGRNGPVKFALSAIDIALWDIAGQAAGLPLYRLLGGARPTLERYASLMRYGEPEAVARNTRAAVAAGFRLVKLHESTREAFLAAHEAAGGQAEVALDVNCPWTTAEARAMAHSIAGRGFAWLEEPVWPPEDFAAMAAVRTEGVPVAAGENVNTLHDFRRLFEAGAVDVVQPSVVKVGGVSAMLEVFALARAFSVRVVPHCFYWGPGYLATAHLAAAQPVPPPVETGFITLEADINPAFGAGSAAMELSQTAAGLGFAPDAAAMARYTVWSARLGGS